MRCQIMQAAGTGLARVIRGVGSSMDGSTEFTLDLEGHAG